MVLKDEQIREVIETIESSNTQLNLYDELAPIYENLYAEGYNFDKQADLVDEYTTEDIPTIVDLGCGTGELIYKLAKRNPRGRFIGVDLSTKLLENARSERQHRSSKYLEMDYMNLEKYMEPVNTYASFGSLTSHPEPEEMQDIFGQVYNTLYEGGRLIIDYHSPVKSADDGWVDSDGNVTEWNTETDSFKIGCTIITVDRGSETHYTVGYEITVKDSGETYRCSQKIPLQFYEKSELKERLNKAGFDDILYRDTAPDRSGTIIATK